MKHMNTTYRLNTPYNITIKRALITRNNYKTTINKILFSILIEFYKNNPESKINNRKTDLLKKQTKIKLPFLTCFK